MKKLYMQRNTGIYSTSNIITMIVFVLIALLLVGVIINGGQYIIYSSLLAIFGLIVLLCFAKMRNGIHISLMLVIVTVTINSERFGIPVKLDSIAVPFLGILLLLTVPVKLINVRYYLLVLPVCGFLLANVIASWINSPIRAVSLGESAILVGRGITFFLTTLAVQHNPKMRSKFPFYLSVILIVQTAISIMAIFLYSHFPTPFVYYGLHGESVISINGLFLEPNLFGIAAVSIVSILLPMMLFRGTKNHWYSFIAISIGIIGIVLSNTRSCWIGIILVLCCLAPIMVAKASMKARRYYSILVITLILIGISFVSVVVLLALLGTKFGLPTRLAIIADPNSASAFVRVITWRAAVDDWLQHIWFGTGPLSFEVSFPSTQGWVYSSVLQTLHDSGIIGLFFMLWICAGCMFYAWRAYARSVTEQDKAITLGYFLALLVLFFTSQFSSFFWGGFTWVLFGLAVGHSKIIFDQTTRNPVSHFRHRFMFLRY